MTDQDNGQVVEALANTALALVCESIDDAHGAVDVEDRRCRANMAYMLSIWPTLCHTAHRALYQDNSWAAVVFYERTRLRLTNKNYFLDGVPGGRHGLPIMGAPIVLEFPVDRMRELLYEDAVKERTDTIDKLETYNDKKLKQLAQSLDGLPDVSERVPLRARLFLSRVRSMCHGLRAAGVKPESHFVQCHNERCMRYFYKGERAFLKPPHTPSRLYGGFHESLSYWMECTPLPTYDGPQECRFCCRACDRQWWRDWRRALPDEAIDYDADPRTFKFHSADVSVTDSFERAIERNWHATKEMKRRRKHHVRKGSAVSRADLNREFDARIEMLNIDTGLLYAAKTYQRLPVIRGNLTLPGAKRKWRLYAAKNLKNALTRVARIYRQHAEKAPIYELLNMPSFFSAIRSRVTEIFEAGR